VLNFIVALAFTTGSILWADANSPWLAALWALVAGIWWAALVQEISNG
jgi:hypothetical protein